MTLHGMLMVIIIYGLYQEKLHIRTVVEILKRSRLVFLKNGAQIGVRRKIQL